MVRWIALFSQTGSEIVDLANRLGRWPDRVLSNNTDVSSMHPDIRKRVRILSHTGIEEQLQYEDEFAWDTMVTLHGYLRIISSKVIETSLKIYNGHPGYISKYPELIGKDPQEKVANNLDMYPVIGSTVHKVIAEVDEGEIVSEVTTQNQCQNRDEVYSVLRLSSSQAWVNFLEGKINVKE